MYRNGQGLTQDYAEAAKWFRKAAKQGEANAQCTLGMMYIIAQGVAQDYIEAYKFLKLAADQNHENAMTTLKEIRERMTDIEISEGNRRFGEFKAAHS
jgi:TPR repeat protein